MSLSLDGHISAGLISTAVSSIASTAKLTTTSANDIIVTLVCVVNNGGAATTVSSVSASGGTGTVGAWTKRFSSGSVLIGSGAHADLEIWWALASTTLSSMGITVNTNAPPGMVDFCTFAVSGANTTTPFDTNGSIPASATSQSSSATPSVGGVSTTNANTLLFAVTAASNVGSPGAGYSSIDVTNVNSQDNEYQIVTAAQSSISVAFGSGDVGTEGFAIVADALQQASAVAIIPAPRRNIVRLVKRGFS